MENIYNNAETLSIKKKILSSTLSELCTRVFQFHFLWYHFLYVSTVSINLLLPNRECQNHSPIVKSAPTAVHVASIVRFARSIYFYFSNFFYEFTCWLHISDLSANWQSAAKRDGRLFHLSSSRFLSLSKSLSTCP